jgi:hypothetical protein
MLMESILEQDGLLSHSADPADFIILTKNGPNFTGFVEYYQPRLPAGSKIYVVESHLADFPKSKPEPAFTKHKLALWNMTAYDRIMFIDPDCFLEDSIINLWDMPRPLFTTMAHNPFSSSMFYLTPSLEDCEQLLDIAYRDNFSWEDGWDNCGRPNFPEWHKRTYGLLTPYGGDNEQSRLFFETQPWRFGYSHTEEGLFLYYFHMLRQRAYSCQFQGVFHLSHANREEILARDEPHPYLEAAARYGLKEELLQICREHLSRLHGRRTGISQ